MDIVARGAAALLTLALPLAVAAWLSRRLKVGWRLILIGGATFILAQLLHLPFNAAILNPWMAQLGLETRPGPGLAGAALLLGLSAGVFEEGARWLVYRFWARRARTWPEGVAFGAGHGGAEALFVGLAALATLIQLTALRGQDLAGIVPAEQLALAQAQVELYWAQPGAVFFLGTLERASALVVQISLAVIVLQAFVRRGGALWLLAAVGWHALVDAVAVYLGVTLEVYSGSIGGALATEAVILGMAGFSLYLLFRLRPPLDPQAAAVAPAPHQGPMPPAAVRHDQLDATRYDRTG